MTRGLGKGLNSLIPEIYDENFDSNGAQSLEDMLKEDSDDVSQDSTVEEKIENDDVDESNEENSEEEIVDDNSNVEEDDENEREESKDNKSENISGGSSEVYISSEEVSGNQGNQDDVSDSQEVKRQENVAEVLDIVDKNPRITLWSSRSAAVFRYLRKTEPEFSISREASILIDEAVSKKYPEIWDLFEDLK